MGREKIKVAKPLKPISEMTEEELDAYAVALKDATVDRLRPQNS